MDSNIYGFSQRNITTRLRRVERTVPYLVRGNAAFSVASTQTVSTSAVSNLGVVDLTSSGVQKQGSVPPAGITGQFSATGTTTSISWYWDGTNGSLPIVINRVDGSYQSVPAGNITVSGLSANTAYYFLPFWSVPANRLGWVIGKHGNPQIAFLAADTTSASAQTYLTMQQLQSREQLTNGWMSYATPASGTNTGNGGGGGAPGNCVADGTCIEPLGDYGEMEQGIHREQFWRHLVTDKGKQLKCSQKHPIYVCDKYGIDALTEALKNPTEEELTEFKIDAINARPVFHYIATEDGVEKLETNFPFMKWGDKRSVHLTRGHLYMANGILSHNQKMNSL